MLECYKSKQPLDRQANTVVGLSNGDDVDPVVFLGEATIRSGTVIYANSTIGDGFQTGHNVMVREKSTIGKHVLIGTGTVVDGNVVFGSYIKIETNCYICTHVKIGNRCFIGPNVTFTNDRYPLRLRDSYKPEGPILEDNVTIGGGVTICPGVSIGTGSFVAAGALVVKDVPPNSLVKGNPGKIFPLPDKLCENNMALSWQKYIDKNTGELA